MPVNDNLYSEDHMNPCLASISCLLLILLLGSVLPTANNDFQTCFIRRLVDCRQYIFCSQQRMKTTDFKPGQGYPETKLLKLTGSTLFTYRLRQKFSSYV